MEKAAYIKQLQRNEAAFIKAAKECRITITMLGGADLPASRKGRKKKTIEDYVNDRRRKIIMNT